VNAEDGTGFAGYSDWRVPEVDEEGGADELETLLLEPHPCGSTPCIDPIFGPTVSYDYWSSSTYAGNADYAWGVNFSDGGVGFDRKDRTLYVRAVRGP
jgi:hypothetical protein